MCLDFAARVVAVEDGVAQVDHGGRLRRASTLLLPATRAGDWVRIALGTIVEVLPANEAEEMNRELANAREAD